jgi:hypothetical protein
LFLGQFKELDNLIAGDGWVVFKEFVDGRTAFDVIEEVLDRYAGSLKAGCSADAIRVDPDNLIQLALLFRGNISNLREWAVARKLRNASRAV